MVIFSQVSNVPGTRSQKWSRYWSKSYESLVSNHRFLIISARGIGLGHLAHLRASSADHANRCARLPRGAARQIVPPPSSPRTFSNGPHRTEGTIQPHGRSKAGHSPIRLYYGHGIRPYAQPGQCHSITAAHFRRRSLSRGRADGVYLRTVEEVGWILPERRASWP